MRSDAKGWLWLHWRAYLVHLHPRACRWCGAPNEAMPSYAYRCPVCDVAPPRRHSPQAQGA